MRFIAIVTFIVVVCVMVVPTQAELRVGAAAVDITPPLGIPMAGYYHVRLSEAKHDPLYAKALVFEDAGVKAAIVSCDLVSVPRDIVVQARQAIEQKTGVSGSSVMISGTHSHTGPVTSVDGMERAGGPAGAKGKEYLKSLPGLIAESVRLAESKLGPARVKAAVGKETSLAFNRRYLMKDGTVGWNPGKLNPNIVRPVGPVDPQVPLVVFESGKSDRRAAFVNFSMHLDTVGGLYYSADYPGTIYELLSQVYGPEMVTFFTMGASGNVNHINVGSNAPQKGSEEAARIGTTLTGEILKTFGRLEEVSASPVQVKRRMLQLDLPKIDPAEIGKSKEIAAKYGKPGAAPFLEMVHAFKVLDTAARKGEPIEAEVQVITLGDQVAWVGLPGEIFVELGLAVKTASPFRYTIVSTLANGAFGYFPDLKAFREGNYEPVSARTAPGSGERLANAATELLVDCYGNLRTTKAPPGR